MIIIALLIGMTAWQTVTAQSVTVTPATADICAGSGTNVTLLATPTGGMLPTYAWSPGGNTTQSINVSPAVTTVYTVTVTFFGGTTAVNTATVTVIPQPPQATITPVLPTTVCTGSTVQLNASAGDAWQWYLNGSPISGATTQTHIANVSGDYTVLVTVGTCNAPMSAITNVSIIPLPIANVTPNNPQNTCFGGSILLTADPVMGAAYQWQYSPDGYAPWSTIVGATNQTYNATISGWNRVQVTVGGCVNYSY